MYSQSVTSKHLSLAESRVQRSFPDFKLEYHSVKQVDQANEHFSYLVTGDGRLVRKLKDDEVRWIRNERILSKWDFRYWSTRYAYIIDRRNALRRFAPNMAQKIIMDVWSEHEERQIAILLQQGKARQLGVSTLTELAVAHRAQFFSHINAVVASSDPMKSRKMSGMMELNWDPEFKLQPWFMLPAITSYRIGELIEFGKQGSAISIQHGTQFTGIARGTTPTVVHLSECSDYDHPEELIDASLMRAIHDSPWVFVVFESTAKGMHNWWHKKWEFNKTNWPQGRSRVRPLFLPWFIGVDQYPEVAWLRAHPVPGGWQPLTSTLDHKARSEQYVKSDPLLSKYLSPYWTMPLEQAWFYEVEREEYRAMGKLNMFLQEVPADDIEMFQSSNASVFGPEVIELYHNKAQSPLAVYAIQADKDDLPVMLQPDKRDIDSNKPSLKITCNWNLTQKPYIYTLVPIRFNGWPVEPDESNRIYIFEWPEVMEDYGIGVDTAEGIGQDRTVIEVIRKGRLGRRDAQCAEFASSRFSAIDAVPVTLALATLYSTEANGVRKQPRLAIECRSNGEMTQIEIRKRGWQNFHPWMHYDRKNLNVENSQKLGVFTNYAFRSDMLEMLMKYLRDEWLDIRSPLFVKEMSSLEADIYKQSLRAAHGGHDDRIMALGFALFSLHILDFRGNQSLIAPEVPKPGDPKQYARYSPSFQGSDFSWKNSPLHANNYR